MRMPLSLGTPHAKYATRSDGLKQCNDRRRAGESGGSNTYPRRQLATKSAKRKLSWGHGLMRQQLFSAGPETAFREARRLQRVAYYRLGKSALGNLPHVDGDHVVPVRPG